MSDLSDFSEFRRKEEGRREGARCRDEGVARAEWAMPLEWAEVAYRVCLALNLRCEWSTDEVWMRLDDLGVPPPPEPRAMAAVIERLKREGLIEFVRRDSSCRPQRHRGTVTVWKRREGSSGLRAAV